MKKLLITGFDPFGGETVNPAWEAVKRLPDTAGEYVLCKLLIPTVYAAAAQKVLDAARELKPDVILCIGQAGGRNDVTPERIGINLRLARIPDNAGNRPEGEPVVPGGADGYFATVPVDRMAQAIRDAGYPASVSNTAGTFVCNDVLYTVLHACLGTNVRAGFLHVPFLPEQGQPSLPLEDTVKALEAAISAL